MFKHLFIRKIVLLPTDVHVTYYRKCMFKQIFDLKFKYLGKGRIEYNRNKCNNNT